MLKTWDYAYEVACNIIQTFESDYPSPPVDVIVQSLKSASTRANSNKLDDVIEWSKDYAEKWYKENMGAQELKVNAEVPKDPCFEDLGYIQVVRCEECSCFNADCDYCNKLGITIHDDDFCSFAEKK